MAINCLSGSAKATCIAQLARIKSMAAMTRDAGQGPGTGGGRRKSYEPEHAGHSSVAEEDSFFSEFFDGVPFDAPCTLGDLLKSDEPPSPSTAAANERWLQIPHPEQFFKETDGFVVEGNGHLHPSSPVAAGSDARETKSQARDKMCSKAPAVLVLSEKENRDCKVPVKGVSEKKQAATAATRGGMDGGRDIKRRRAPGSVSTVASKSLASRANTTGTARRQQAAKDKLKDPMKEKLEEYKRNTKPALSARRTTGKTSGDACSEPKKTSVGGSRGLRSVNARNPSTLPTASRVGTRTVAAGKHPGVERGVRGEASQGASKKESSEVTVPPVMEVVTRSVKMVKRRTGGGVLGRGCGRDQANGGSRGTGAGVGGGVKKTRRGPIGGDSRRAGPTRGGGKGKAAVGLNEPALVLDAQLEARLAEHNKGVARGKHTYEPKRNVRDTRMWEAKTGKVYRSLTVDERADANKEIDAMRAAMRRATLGGH